MKILILSQNTQLYSTRRLLQAGKKRGHQMRIIDPLRCYMNITAHHPTIHFQGLPLQKIDAVIPRISTAGTFYATAVLRQFEMTGIFTTNESAAISRSRDKLHSLQLLTRNGIEIPITGFADNPDDITDLFNQIGSPPYVIKLLEGTQGIGVVLTETRKAAESVIEAFMGLKTHILVQEFIAEANGTDIRCFVIGNNVVAAIKRQAIEGEFRSNLHRGGQATMVQITEVEKNIAIRAAQTLGLNIAGVDIIRSHRGPLVMEVNSSPGLEGIEKATQVDIAQAIIRFIEKQAKCHTSS